MVNTFDQLDLIEPLRRAIRAQSYEQPTPVQAAAIPLGLEGRDVRACAQTGTGKTASFALPVLQQLINNSGSGRRKIRALILAPTRELAAQIAESFEVYGQFSSLRVTTIYGGVSEKPQIKALRAGVDIVAACPGRLLDLMGRGFVDLSNVEHFILDEADRMLDMGFVPDIRRISRELPSRRQNLLFSATMPQSIISLSNDILHNPAEVHIEPENPTIDRIEQFMMFVGRRDKSKLLTALLADPEIERSIVFTRTKRGANRLTKRLNKHNFSAIAIHGNKSQNARRRALDGFRDGNYRILVATDVASRGIDVDDISHVFNYNLPNIPESYVHRIGRTGRAGRNGTAVSFCDESETEYLVDIEKILGEKIPQLNDHPLHHEAARPSAQSSGGSSSGRKNSGNRKSSRRKNSRRKNSGGRGRSRGGRRSSRGSRRRNR